MRPLYARIGRSLFWLARPALKLYFLAFPTKRVRVIVMDSNDNVVCIKGWFSRQRWELPGGGIKRGELPVMAAVRELREETGLSVPKQALRPMGEFTHSDAVTPYTVVLYFTKIDGKTPPIAGRKGEIIAAAWHRQSALPTEVSPVVDTALKVLQALD